MTADQNPMGGKHATTNSNVSDEPCCMTMNDVVKLRLRMEGFSVIENRLLPGNMMQVATKNKKHFGWVNVDTGKFHVLDIEAIFEDLHTQWYTP